MKLGPRVTTLLWEEAELHGFVVEPADLFGESLATKRAFRQASTWGEIRAAEDSRQQLNANMRLPADTAEPAKD